MSERYDYNKIPGSNNMSARDKRYFSKFGNRMADQAEVIVNNHNLDSETMKEEYILLMNNLVSDPAEYIVEGAPLACTLQTNVVQKVSYKGMSLFSVPREKNRDENTKIEETEAVTPPSTMSTLRIPDENRITFAGYVPATVTDAKGGLRDVKPTVSQEKNDVEKDEEGLNIVSFGNCQGVNNDTPIEVLAQEIYTSIRGRGGNITLTEIEEKMKLAIEKGKGVCYCAMMLNSEWENLPLGYDFRTETYENTNSGLNQFSTGIDQAFSRTYQMFNGKEGINMMSMIFCTRGGIVAAKESGQVRTSFNIEMGEPDLVVDNWLKLYSNPTVSGGGRNVPKHKDAASFDWAMDEEINDGERDGNWFASSSYAYREITKMGTFSLQTTSNNLYTDAEGRYWVAVGPNVVNPEHSKEKKETDIDASEMYYGTKLDIVVENEFGERYYIPAVVGDAKEHSYPDGLYQTGVPFNKNRSTDTSSAGNTVEFIGYDISKKIYDDGKIKSSINVTNSYKIVEIIVYDGVFNYE